MFLAWVIRNWKLVAVGLSVIALLSAGIWFRGVLADREELTAQNKAQAQDIADLNGEVERMNKQQAADHALFENIEAQRKIHAAEVQKQTENIRKLRKDLDLAAKNCFDLVLPQSYIDGLPR